MLHTYLSIGGEIWFPQLNFKIVFKCFIIKSEQHILKSAFLKGLLLLYSVFNKRHWVCVTYLYFVFNFYNIDVT